LSLVLADRVQETTTTTGTGTINLGGAVTQFQSFVSGIGNGNTAYYCIVSGDATNWEVGQGTVTSGSPDTLSRTTILASSNSGSAISLTGTSTVFGDAPAAFLSAVDFTSSGTWSGDSAYSPGDVVTYGAGPTSYVCYAPISAPPSGAPTLDGSNGVQGVNTSGSITLTTTNADDLIVFCASLSGGSVSSITSTGLTFTERASQSGQGGVLYVYTAQASAILSSQTISFTWSGDEFFEVCVFGVSGFNAFDTDGSLPLSASSGTLTLTTLQANDFILYFEGGGFGGTQSPPSGFTNIYGGDIDGQTMGVSYQRVSSTQSGVSYTVPANSDLIIDALAAPGGPTPNPTPDIDTEHWISATAVPTSTGTGLTTWLNQGSATVADTEVGVCITAPAQTSFNALGRYKAAPSTPYTATAKVCLTTVPVGHAPSVFLGWYDGSDKLHVVALLNNTGGPHWAIEVDKATNPTSFDATDFSTTISVIVGPVCWLQIEDDGTDVYFRFSNDGGNFLQVFTVAKSSGWLGSSGYANVIFGTNSDNESGTEVLATLMSYSD
jgi:hypothetical protein